MATKHGEVLFNFREEPISPISFIPFLVPIFEGRVSILVMGAFGFSM
jgi:hypothetical protein